MGQEALILINYGNINGYHEGNGPKPNGGFGCLYHEGPRHHGPLARTPGNSGKSVAVGASYRKVGQVPAEENLSAIGKALKKAGNQEVTLKELPGLNHMLQKSATGAPSEYGTNEETFSPAALAVISDWVKEQVQ